MVLRHQSAFVFSSLRHTECARLDIFTRRGTEEICRHTFLFLNGCLAPFLSTSLHCMCLQRGPLSTVRSGGGSMRRVFGKLIWWFLYYNILWMGERGWGLVYL